MRHTLAAGSLPFSSLNQACLRDAACLYVPEKAEMDAPVQVSVCIKAVDTEKRKTDQLNPSLSRAYLMPVYLSSYL